MPHFLTWESMGQSSTIPQIFTSFHMYLLFQFSTIFNHSTSHLFKIFRPSKLLLVFFIAFTNFQLFSFKVDQLFNFLENLTLKSMGRFCTTPPTSRIIFSLFHQLSTPFQAWIVHDIQVFQTHVDFFNSSLWFSHNSRKYSSKVVKI